MLQPTPQPAPVTVSGPPPRHASPPPGAPQARFDGGKFDEQVSDKGYNALLRRLVPCPCAGHVTGSALGTCRSCGGLTLVVVEQFKVRAVFSSMNGSRKNSSWSENLVGTASITVDSATPLAEYDQLTHLDATGVYTELLPPGVADPLAAGGWLFYPTYSPLAIAHLLAFVSPAAPLRRLELSADYVLTPGGAVQVLPSAQLPADAQLSARYSYHPTYQIVEITRDVVSSPALTNLPRGPIAGLDPQQPLPQHATGRRLHFVEKALRPGQLPLLPATSPPVDPLAYIRQSNSA